MRYKIEFLDYWHIGSGVSAGVMLDSVVIKDNDDLPYVPAKTLKGLLREMAIVIDADKAKKLFGDQGANQAEILIKNATLPEDTKAYLNQNRNLKKYLFAKLTSTKIDEKTGIADDQTLREIEVVVPLELYGEIVTEDEEFLKKTFAMVKRMGLNRNRGLGRCKISEVKDAK